jgi:hypothetical protein
MSTAIQVLYRSDIAPPTTGATMTKHSNSALRPDLQEIVRDLLGLKALEKNERFITHKAQREILSKLNPADLTAVARALFEANQQASNNR